MTLGKRLIIGETLFYDGVRHTDLGKMSYPKIFKCKNDCKSIRRVLPQRFLLERTHISNIVYSSQNIFEFNLSWEYIS